MRCSQPSARSFGVERQQLLTKGQIFKHEVLTGLEGANRPAENVPEPRDHGENINETSPTELIPKPMILRMYGVLMTHRGSPRVDRHMRRIAYNYRELLAYTDLP